MKKIVQTAGRNALNEFAPQFAHFNDDVLFGENWNNQDIDVKTRCIITVTALIASGMINTSLVHHFENAKAHGVTQKEIAAVITHIAFYAGWPKGWAAFNLAKDVWSIDEGDLSYEDEAMRAHAKSGGGQILICIAGRGYYQEEGKEAVEMKPGDCVNIPAEVKHWHGAAPDEWFSHLAIEVPGEKTSSEWCEIVTDAESRNDDCKYAELATQEDFDRF